MVARLKHLGHTLTEEEMAHVFRRFKEIGDRKKFVYDDDLAALVEDSSLGAPETYELEYIHITSGTTTIPTATVRLRRNAAPPTRAKRDGEAGR